MAVKYQRAAVGVSATNEGAPKVSGIIDALQSEVLSGRLAPGERLGTWEEMERRFNVGRPTLVRALDRLKKDGLVVADSTRGTFVADRPPHLHRFALVFNESPGTEGWNRLWAALPIEAQSLAVEEGNEVIFFYGCRPNDDNEPFARLRKEARSGRLAGAVVIGGGALVEPENLNALGLPVVAMQSPPLPKTAPVVWVDYDSFDNEALKWLSSRGRRRPAVITNIYNAQMDIPDRLAQFGMSAKKGWLQGADTKHPWWAGQVVRMLFDVPLGPDRPDSLIVTDDNLAESVLAAIVEMGIQVPTDIDLVVSCNMSVPITPVIPMLRLAFDNRQMLKLAFKTLTQLRKGEKTTPIQLVPAVELAQPFLSLRPPSSSVSTAAMSLNAAPVG